MTVKRTVLLQKLLDFIGLGGRLHLEWISSAEAQKFVSVVTTFTERIRDLGPSPLREVGPAPRPEAAPGPGEKTLSPDLRCTSGEAWAMSHALGG